MAQGLAAPTHASAPPRQARTESPEVSVCIANWNCAAMLRACLESLYGQPQGASFEVVIADNGSADGAPEMVAREFPQVTLIRNPDNRGFATASNQAAAAAHGRFLFFLNNDTVVPAGTLRRLIAAAEANPGAGMIGPRLRGADGLPQVSYRRRPTMAALLHKVGLLRWTGLFRRAYREYRRETFDPSRPRVVEVLLGAAVFLPREAFDACGGWDEGFGFGVEDVDLSERVGRRAEVVYAPQAEVVHHGRAAGRANIDFAAPNVAIGYARFFRKAGASRPALFAYKAAVTIDAPVQLVHKMLEAGYRYATRRPAKARKSLLAARGLWAFLRYELARFWKA